MKLKNTFAFLAIAVLGFLSILIPALLNSDLKQYEAPLFPLLRTALEGISMYSFGLLFLSGALVKYVSEPSFWKIGLMSMVLFPIATFCEIIADSTSHNMFPIEFILYIIYSTPAIVGAYFSHKLKGLIQTKRN